MNAPQDWHAAAHAQWHQGQPSAAIELTLAQINRHGRKKPAALVLQLAYYLFLSGNPAAGAQVLAAIRPDYPDHLEVLLNLAVCLTRSGQYPQAIPVLRDYLQRDPGAALAHSALCSCLSKLGKRDEAAAAGTQALALLDARHGAAPAGWRVPDSPPHPFASAPGKRDVIAFSLWGAKPRYLRGAIDNALAAPKLYPGWKLRFYVDDSVPRDALNALAELGCEVMAQAPGQGLRQKLCWRFQVANDPAVGRFLIRDADSVVNPREQAAVAAWLASEQWFHVMRDWWTHTDLMLAGMWGGVAGALPDMAALLSGYRLAHLETPNIDQWFLRDRVWAYVRQSCLVHDRCFASRGAQPWPSPAPQGDAHVGQDEFSSQAARQAARLGPWLEALPSLRA